MPHPLASMCAPPWPPMPMCMMQLRKDVCTPPRMPRQAGYQSGRFFLQHGQACAAPCAMAPAAISLDVQFLAGCGDSLPRMPRFPLCQGGRADFLHQQVRNQIFPAAADGYGREHCPDRLCRLAGGAPAADCFTGTRPWLPDPWRGNARPFRRRGPAPEAGQRDGQSPVGLSVCL